MKRMKSSLTKILVVLCMATVFAVTVPAQALAYTLHVTNNYSDNLFVARLDWSDSAGDWRTKGWYAVEPHSTKHITINDSTAKKNVYLYAKTSEASFGGDGYPKSVSRFVISDAFDYLGANGCPSGRNYRKVYFANYEIEDGHVNYTP